MARKPISYPLDYENDRTLRGEYVRGVVFVTILTALCVVLSVVSIALRVRGGTLRTVNAEAILEKLPQGFRAEAIFGGMPFDTSEPQTIQPSERPVLAKTPAPTPAVTPGAEQTPAVTVVPTATPSLDPDFMDDAAEPFAETFESLPDAIDAVAPGVVGVINWQPYEQTQRFVEWGSGSGFIITTDGYVLTNQHVVEGAQRITVKLTTEEEYEAVLVGADRTSDIAVLKIEAEGLTALPKGDSDAVRVGEFVFAIGDPVQSELSGTVTFGIISAKSRSINIEGFTNEYIQTDAAINLGNSGGPLIDMHGNVIGMNSAKTVTAGYDESGRAIAAEGIGFALPINRVWEIATQLISDGGVQKPGIGVQIKQTRAEYRDITLEEGGEVRPYIDSVTEGGPADLAGIKANDVVLAVDGNAFTEMEDIVSYIQKHTKVGQEIVFTLERNGESIEVTVVVGDLNRMP